MRAITLDIETTSASAMRGRLDPAQQELTVVAIHDSKTGEYSSYFKEELPRLWPLIEQADLLIGFNSDTFDIPILNRYYPGDLSAIHSLDLLVEVQKALGRRIRLQLLAEATLDRGKSGSGLKAIDWWAQGKYDEVRKYCIEDVRITRELYDYALTHHKLKYKDLSDIRDIKLDTRTWNIPQTKPALTYTLPI
ncbi:MAG: hypothetical protein B7X04_01650 [Parcubacteria group bacterium 21-54-25]|nr:MAG: hypothetical protein B7X04_01650 [Parcubacteria group bacterium 21-54-25]HQU07629.1 ribonuclease H-like domain-containing protein [Candidatus Paceibacterota bacterium]